MLKRGLGKKTDHTNRKQSTFVTLRVLPPHLSTYCQGKLLDIFSLLFDLCTIYSPLLPLWVHEEYKTMLPWAQFSPARSLGTILIKLSFRFMSGACCLQHFQERVLLGRKWSIKVRTAHSDIGGMLSVSLVLTLWPSPCEIVRYKYPFAW